MSMAKFRSYMPYWFAVTTLMTWNCCLLLLAAALTILAHSQMYTSTLGGGCSDSLAKFLRELRKRGRKVSILIQPALV